jgi:hypothetical protein
MPPKPTLFGRLIESTDVQNAAQETIEEWIETYLAEYERQRELDPKTIQVIETYTQVNEFRDWAGNETPVCVIVSPELPETSKKGGGEYTGQFILGIGIIVQADTRPNTNKMARAYGAIIRQLLLQQAGLGGLASGITFESEKYNDVPEGEDRAQASAQVIFTVEVPGIVDSRKGTIAPSENPYGDDSEAPTAESAEVTIKKEDEVGP